MVVRLILDPPEVKEVKVSEQLPTTYFNKKYYFQNKKLTLICDIKQGNPLLKFKWLFKRRRESYYEDKSVCESSKCLPMKLNFEKLNSKDSGIYQCASDNIPGIFKKELKNIELNVACKLNL